MATQKTSDPSELLYKGQSVLGKPTTVETPGTVGQPLSAGIAAPPALGGGPGQPAAGGPEPAGPGGGTGAGPSVDPKLIEGIAQKIAKAADSGGGSADPSIGTQGFSLTGPEGAGFQAQPGEFTTGGIAAGGALSDPTLALNATGLLTGHAGGLQDTLLSLASDPGIRAAFASGTLSQTVLNAGDYALGFNSLLADPTVAASPGIASSLTTLGAQLGPQLAGAVIAALPSILQATGAEMTPSEAATTNLGAQVAGQVIGTAAPMLLGQAAAWPLAAATLPVTIIQGIEDIKTAQNVERDAAALQKELAGPIRELQGFIPKDVPASYETITNPASTPDQILAAYTRSKYLQDLFNAHDTRIKGGGNVLLGGMASAHGFTRGMEEALRPYMQMNEAAMVLGQDALDRAGLKPGTDYQPFWTPGAGLLGSFGFRPYLDTHYYPEQRVEGVRQQLGAQGLGPEQIDQAIQNAMGAGTVSGTARWDPAAWATVERAFQEGGSLAGGLQRLSAATGLPISNTYLLRALGGQTPSGPAAAPGTAPGPTGEQIDELIRRAAKAQ